MSTYFVRIDKIDGEAKALGYEDWIECIALSHAMYTPIDTMSSRRTASASVQGAIHMIHHVDKATPGLLHACSAGTNLGKVQIVRAIVLDGSQQVQEAFLIENTYIARMELETPVDPSTRKPAEEPLETFALEYSKIYWDYNTYQYGKPQGTTSATISVSGDATGPGA